LQPVFDGKPKGAPQLIKADLGSAWPMGFTHNGTFYYGLDSGMNDTYMAGVDLKSNKVTEAPAPLTQRFIGSNSGPAWSADGKYLAYVSQRGPGTTSIASKDKVLAIRSLDTGRERDLLVNLAVISRPQWWPDGKSILVAGQDRTSRNGIYRIDAQTGEITVLVQEEGNNYRYATVSQDGSTVFYLELNVPNKTSSIRAHDVQTGKETEIYTLTRPKAIASLGLSTDGQIAFAVGDISKLQQPLSLKVMPATGGEAREVCQINGDLGINRLIWTPDSQRILFVLRHQDPAKPGNTDQMFEVWQVPSAGGPPQKVGLAMERLRDLTIHPDGKRLAFTVGQLKPEVWVMENFIPAPKARNGSVSRR
jgi:Tol biopolymer transport system component